MRKSAVLLFAVILLVACTGSNDVPSGILKPVKMQAVLWDVMRADAFSFEYIRRDSSKNTEAENVKIQQQIFAVHQTNKDEFYKSFDYYRTHTDLFQPLLDSMVNKANREKYKLTQKRQTVKTVE
ncbi:MAG: DUF4296 domain-containing protein [Bacteroidetes bacterium]|nr:DUF4296 domain-containing protein [Bacteroidota bacterium]